YAVATEIHTTKINPSAVTVANFFTLTMSIQRRHNLTVIDFIFQIQYPTTKWHSDRCIFPDSVRHMKLEAVDFLTVEQYFWLILDAHIFSQVIQNFHRWDPVVRLGMKIT